MSQRYAIDPRSVVWDILDGEAVMLHRESGDYFSADGTGCLIWQWVAEGRSRTRILDGLAARYATEAGLLAGAVDLFIADLLRHRLVEEVATGDDPPAEPEAAATEPAAFVPPALNVYSDIRNLLLLDPIHEVTEAGWPSPNPTKGDGTK